MHKITTAAAVAGLLLTTACTTSAGGSAAGKPCTFTWADVDDRDVLAAVSEAKTLKKDEKWLPSMRVLRRGTAQVTGIELDDPQAAITSLGRHVGQGLAPIGETYPSERRGETSFAAAGRYVVYQTAPHLVDATFVVECGGKRLGSGHATSWEHGESGGTTECDAETQDDDPIAREARRLAC